MNTLKKVTIGILATLGGLFVLLTLLVVGLAATNTSTNIPDEQPTYKVATADEVFTLVNQKRGEAGVEPLISMNELNVSAQFKAEDMANRMYDSHTDPATGKNNGVNKAIELAGYSCSYISENLYTGTIQYVTAESAVSSWMESPSHREAMLNGDYNYTGIGIAQDKTGKAYQVQHFCKVK